MTAKITFFSHLSDSSELPSFHGVARQTVELLTEHAESHFSTGFCPESFQHPPGREAHCTSHITHSCASLEAQSNQPT